MKKIMKRVFFIIFILLYTWILYAQDSITVYNHEVKVSYGDAIYSETLLHNRDAKFNVFATYYYRIVNKFWVGINFINYFGDKIYYNTRKYAIDGSLRDFSKSKTKYCAVIAPEIRWSYVYKKSVNLYSAFSTGMGWENGFDNNKDKYPKQVAPYVHLTCLGLRFNLGENNNKNIFIGGEFGIGYKGVFNFYGGFRF
jgi:hypothetical protein